MTETNNAFVTELMPLLMAQADMNESDAAAQADKVVKLKKMLVESPKSVRFSYLKKDGAIRQAIGTLNLDLIPPDSSTFVGMEHTPLQVRYYDTDSCAWRSFLAQNLI